MKKIKCITMLLGAGFFLLTWSAPVEVTLQNGLQVNGAVYKGCVDSYIMDEDAYSNFSTESSLGLKYELCTS